MINESGENQTPVRIQAYYFGSLYLEYRIREVIEKALRHRGIKEKAKRMLFGANTEGMVFRKDEDSYGRDARTTCLNAEIIESLCDIQVLCLIPNWTEMDSWLDRRRPKDCLFRSDCP